MLNNHRDKTRVQMPAKNISTFESKMLAVYGPHSWFWKQFFDQVWCFFTIKTRFLQVIHS